MSSSTVNAREDKQLWGEQYSRKVADTASVQQEIATAISATLQVRLSSEEKTRFRAWANMATARRISDSRVDSWVEAGKP